MTWDVTDLGFRMGLSPQGAGGARRSTSRPLVDDLLARHGRTVSDVDGWAVHPGGPRILDVVEKELGLTDDQLAASRGGAGRARQLLVADRAADPRCDSSAGRTRRTRIVVLAFGPGLTLYAALLEHTG